MKSKYFCLFFEDNIPTTTSQQKKYSFKTRRTYEPPKLKAARSLYMEKLKEYIPETKFVGAVELNVVFHFATTDKKKKGTYKRSRPDLDNMCKLFQDCLTQSGFFEDDNAVVRLVFEKRWSTAEAFMEVYITELED